MRISTTVNDEVLAAVREYAARERCSVSAWVRRAVRLRLDVARPDSPWKHTGSVAEQEGSEPCK
ncbi:MAG: ribbon-helix-helix protein, CopG family [Gemmatimonadetes bacterium]|nr:ribbon-helix-helix protein, CopG family [Gemmatimonadota bacterium]MYD15168.1 ribbon-helix-helix protein, CopG family [Gemmatimonadota bacterium]MYI66403.1 ribbon-helix-helix protein, CopG family [Gemmatimonadota bacterium]